MGKCLFDLIFGPELDYDDLRRFRFQLGDKIYEENTVQGDDMRWNYVRAAIKADMTMAPMGLQVLVILQACFVHPCIRNTIAKQFDDSTDPFLLQYFDYLDYVMTDFCSSDPLLCETKWPIAVEWLSRAWHERDVSQPWNTLSTRETGKAEDVKSVLTRKAASTPKASKKSKK